jgi:hypothetical protein
MPTSQREELTLMKEDPRSLFETYLDKITNGETLTTEQIIRLEYLKSLFVKE